MNKAVRQVREPLPHRPFFQRLPVPKPEHEFSDRRQNHYEDAILRDGVLIAFPIMET